MFDQIYCDILFEYANEPKNFRRLQPCDCYAVGKNPICGDMVEVFIRLNDDVISECTFSGHGCAICMCSSSLCTDIVVDKQRNDAYELMAKVGGVFTGTNTDHQGLLSHMNDVSNEYLLDALSNIKTFPMRVKCATLCVHAIQGALDNNISISTEGLAA